MSYLLQYSMLVLILAQVVIGMCPILSSFAFSSNIPRILPADKFSSAKAVHIVFPGGGIYFYWQAGAVSYLREQYDLTNVTLTGASAGALAATLTAAEVDFAEATSLALRFCDELGVWKRSEGLQGIWGPIIHDWLQKILPDNAVDVVQNRLSLLVTPFPWFGKERISSFHNKEDLIACNMASVHLPLFLDGKIATSFRKRLHIDGSFLAKEQDYHPSAPVTPQEVIWLDWKKDPLLANKGLADIVKAASREGIWNLYERGRMYACQMDMRGEFQFLPKRVAE